MYTIINMLVGITFRGLWSCLFHAFSMGGYDSETGFPFPGVSSSLSVWFPLCYYLKADPSLNSKRPLPL